MNICAIVAGTRFHAVEVIRRKCRDGQNVQLFREPRNKFDSNAIAVYLVVPGWLWSKSVKIDNLKAPLAKRLAPTPDAGANVTAKVSSYWVPPEIESPRVSIDIVPA